MTTQETTLYRYRADGPMSLIDAIAACQKALEGAIALLYSPQSCTLARLAPDGTLRDAGDRVLDLTDVFEARLFNAVCELRWLNRLAGVGDAALIAETAQQSLNGFAATKPQACECLPQQYLLWGERARSQPSAESWQRLADARIGKLDIPLAQGFAQDQRVYLKTREYLDAVDDYGNVAVIEERLVKLEVA
ncbi:CRISPR-associated protein Csx19 [Nodosilinea sp. P-1105]|uniref:type III-D CRISPR-associated protein Csx19 n=1 Tax=Nodosilinea sp. P-1105 TaxID=2546229 RepID=UPI001469D446|nr:CRISPR-associated protein Csx19 [Nodosilinea sp. P-1105]NMF84116.1 TIGR03984 family CRISPR-associated protein [Nodosilinea sp. P-1105]